MWIILPKRLLLSVWYAQLLPPYLWQKWRRNHAFSLVNRTKEAVAQPATKGLLIMDEPHRVPPFHLLLSLYTILKAYWINQEDAVRERMNGRERRPIMKTGALLVEERIETDAIVVINREIYHVYTVVFFWSPLPHRTMYSTCVYLFKKKTVHLISFLWS